MINLGGAKRNWLIGIGVLGLTFTLFTGSIIPLVIVGVVIGFELISTNQLTISSPSITCYNCQADIEKDAKFCPECRTPTEATRTIAHEISCPSCAKLVSVNSKFCKHCGSEILLPPQLAAARIAIQTTDASVVKAKLKPPAIALIVNAGIGLASCVFGLMSLGDVPVYYESQRTALRAMQTLNILALPAFVFSIYSALQMMNAKKHGFAVTSAIITIFYCFQTLIGLPIGIWALIVLLRSDTKFAFAREGVPL